MEISLAAEKIGWLGNLPLTNSLLTSWIGLALIIVILIVGSRFLKPIPGGRLQNFVEWIVESFYNLVQSVTEERRLTLYMMPLIATFFLFIIANNWLGILPGIGSIGFWEIHEGKEVFVPIFRSANADLNTTLALAIISVALTQIIGMKEAGFFGYLKKFFNFTNPIKFFIGLLELISEFAKMISFSFRLFGNIFAGEVLLVVITALVPYIAPLPFYGLELFVGFVQALVFAMLTLVFFKIATLHAEH